MKTHRCEKNFDKSSGTMESHAILQIFQRSFAKYGVYYTKYVGDGDSKAFTSLTKTNPYPGTLLFFFLKIVVSKNGELLMFFFQEK